MLSLLVLEHCVHYFEGGALGLFTGVSIISMVEALFWVYKVVKQ